MTALLSAGPELGLELGIENPVPEHKAPLAGGDAPPKAGVKRRAALACLSCRRRKVRCNVVEQSPCTNCRFDEIECSVETCRKKRRGFKFREHAAPGAPSASAAAKEDAIHKSVGPQITTSVDGESDESNASPDPSAIPFLRPWSTMDDIMPIMKYLYTAEDVQPNTSSALGCVESLEGYSSDSTTGSQVHTPEDPSPPHGIVLSCLVRPLLSRISLEDAMYLSLKGALDVPEGPFCDALIEAFINYVYPFLPIVDLSEFLLLMQQHQEELASGKNELGEAGKPASLLLVQAVMFSASAFVDAQYLRDAGFTSRRAARKCFFEKTKLLYTLDCETDPMAISQALLLMAFWHETLDDEKGASHWISVAMDIANTIHTRTLPPAKQRLWKRIRWTCLVRDRLVSLGMRLPLKIDGTTFKYPALTIEDFDIITAPEVISLPFARSTVLSDPVRQRELATMSIAESQLCAHIGRILSTEYEAHSRGISPQSTAASRMLLYPRPSRNREAIDKLDGELRLWEESLPEICTYWSPTDPPDSRDPRAAILLHQIILNLVYQAAIATLHRPNANTPTDDPIALRSSELSKLRVSNAARSITHMAADLYRLRLDSYLPSAAVTVLIPAILTLIVEWKSSTAEKARQETMRNIFYCRRVLERLREVYSGGDHGAELVRAALGCEPEELERQANLEVDDRPGVALAEEPAGETGMEVDEFADIFDFQDVMDAGGEMELDEMFADPGPLGMLGEDLAVL